MSMTYYLAPRINKSTPWFWLHTLPGSHVPMAALCDKTINSAIFLYILPSVLYATHPYQLQLDIYYTYFLLNLEPLPSN